MTCIDVANYLRFFRESNGKVCICFISWIYFLYENLMHFFMQSKVKAKISPHNHLHDYEQRIYCQSQYTVHHILKLFVTFHLFLSINQINFFVTLCFAYAFMNSNVCWWIHPPARQHDVGVGLAPRSKSSGTLAICAV